MARPTITLTSYNLGSDATADDYDAWTDYVAAHLADYLPPRLRVTVEADPFGTPGDDRIRAMEADDADRIREAMRAVWDAWCCAAA